MSIPRYAAILSRRLLFRFSTNAPHVSGDGIAKLCDYIAFGWSGNSRFDDEAALAANSIFVRAEHLEELERNGKRLGLHPVVIVTGNSDRNFEVDRDFPLGCKLWLCQNNAMSPRRDLATLPIGLENRRLGRLGQKRLYRSQMRRESMALTKVFVPPMRPTNPVRIKVVEDAEKHPDLFHVSREYLHERKYLAIVREFQFVLCLEGNGFDSHRIWECLYLGVFPVVIRTKWSESLAYLDLPILLVDKLEDISMEMLKEFISLHSTWSPDSARSLWLDYWRDTIHRAATVSQPE